MHELTKKMYANQIGMYSWVSSKILQGVHAMLVKANEILLYLELGKIWTNYRKSIENI